MQYFIDISLILCYNFLRNCEETGAKKIATASFVRKIRTFLSEHKKAAAKIAAVVLAVLAAAAYYVISERPSLSAAGGAEFHFLYVGQGDATLIRLPEGDVLVDAGPNSSETLLEDSLRSAGVRSLKLFFVTHPDEDHIGGADMIVREFAAGRIYTPDPASREPDARALRAEAARCGTEPRKTAAGDVFYIGGLRIDVLAPIEPFFGDANADSLVLLLTYGETRVLLTGDAEERSENRILDYYGDSLPRCDILKAGHHGSSTSSSEKWLESVRPAIAIISCGKNNPYGHPHAEVLSRLSALGITVYRTDRQGDIVFVSDGITLALRE